MTQINRWNSEELHQATDSVPCSRELTIVQTQTVAMKVLGSCASPTRSPAAAHSPIPEADINAPSAVVGVPVKGASRGYIGIDENVKVSSSAPLASEGDY